MSNPLEKYNRPGAPKIEGYTIQSPPTEEWKKHAASVLVGEVQSLLEAGDIDGARKLFKAYDSDVSQFCIGTEKDLMEPRRAAQQLINHAMEAQKKGPE
jgi:hypothetical protein